MRRLISIVWWVLLISLVVLDNVRVMEILFEDRTSIIHILIILLLCCHIADMYYNDKDKEK